MNGTVDNQNFCHSKAYYPNPTIITDFM